MFRVAEKFVSINGESRRAGELAVFIRFTGCNLNCSYCDTAWAIPEESPHEELTKEEIIEYIKSTGVDNITLTGGEPMLQSEINDLIVDCISLNKRVEIETNGAVSLGSLYDEIQKLSLRDEVSVTLDYKCPGSGMEEFMVMENYDLLREYDTVKFVVSDVADLDRAREIIESQKLVERKVAVYLGPVFGRIEPKTIVEYMMKHKMNGVTNQLQQHKFIWPPEMRGV